uniref:Uncharacterized protein n=1 Tax=Rhizophora mucronata TaxID=61149 RepID=A0A2P2IWW1_RHIMU
MATMATATPTAISTSRVCKNAISMIIDHLTSPTQDRNFEININART